MNKADISFPPNFFRNSLKKLFVLLIFSSIIYSCKPTYIPPIYYPEGRMDYKSPRTLIEHLKANEFKYDWITAKFGCEAVMDDQSNSFTVNLRGRKDSVLWLSISALGIEAARAIVTRDSVKLRNNLAKSYFVGDYNYLSKLLNTDLDFEMLQSLLIGNSVEFYEEDEKLKSGKDNNKYLLSTVRKRRLKKVLEKNEPLKDHVQVIWLEPGIYKIARLLINDFNTNRTFEANYSNYQKVDSLYFPYDLKFNIKAEKVINININYSKVNLNIPQSFPFTIPDNYERKH